MEVKELKLEEQCHMKRIRDWKEKLKTLRNKIMEESCEVKELSKKLMIR